MSPEPFLSLAEQFEAQESLRPDATAVVDEHRVWSYAELNATANNLAHRLLEKEPGEKRPVAVLSGHNGWGLAAQLAALKAGRPYSVLARMSPAPVLRDLLVDLTTTALLCDQEHLAAASQIAAEGVLVLAVDRPLRGNGESNPRLTASPSDLAAIYYTSGSTGRPKGVMRTHASIGARLELDRNMAGLRADDRLVLMRHLHAGASNAAVFGALLNGAALHLLDPAALSPSELARQVQQRRITILRPYTTVLREMLAALPDGFQFEHLRFCRPAGRTLRADIEQLWRCTGPDCRIFHALASTEASIMAYMELPREQLPAGPVIPVGRAAPGVELRLVDDQGRDVADGEVGEVLVSSPAMSPGYWRRPELTAERFRPHPGDPRRAVFHSGDRALRRADGLLDYRGRADEQVKIRGHRVQLEAVEAALEGLPGVAQAAVVARPGADGQPRLEAFIQAEGEHTPRAHDLRRSLAGRVGPELVPARLSVLQSLPQGRTGKVDKSALPHTDRTRPPLDTPYAAPQDARETTLAALWSTVLGVEPLGIHDNFFDLGGDSLQAAQLATAVRDTWQVDLPLQTLLACESVSAMAKAIAAAPAAEPPEMDPNEALRRLGL